jgi:diaminopimelate decarboxylase
MTRYSQLPVPCLIYRADEVRRQYGRLRAFLDNVYPDSRIFYAMKACYCPPVVRLLVDLGCGLELMSESEHRIAADLNVSGTSCIWNGCSLSDEAMRRAVVGGEFVNVDSLDMYENLNRIAEETGRTLAVGLRLNITGSGKLGMSLEEAKHILKIRYPRTPCKGFHFHDSPRRVENLGLLNEARRNFIAAVKGLEDKFGLHLKYVDLGGGLLYDAPLEEQLMDSVQAVQGLGSKPQLFVEPGAFLVEDAGIALTRVTAVKTIGGRKWALVDIGANVMIPLERARFEVENPDSSDVVGEAVNIGGAFGMSADVVAVDQRIPVQRGSPLVIRRCGAYTASMSSCYISAPPPIFWDDGGTLQRLGPLVSAGDRFMEYHGYGKADCDPRGESKVVHR